MHRCSPIEMRKHLVVVDQFKKAGIGFIPIPYTDESDKQLLINMLNEKLDKLSN